MIFTEDGYEPGDDPPGVPLIGYDNQVTGITASTEADGYPASNLLTPATHLKWQASTSAAQTLTITPDAEVNYLAIAKHNLLSSGAKIALAVSSNPIDLTLLIHWDGTDGSTEFQDSSGNDYGILPWNGSPQIDTAQSKFGGASLLLNGSSYPKALWQQVGTSDFTIDFWVRFSSVSGSQTIFDSRDTSVATNGFRIYKASGGAIRYWANGADRITGTTTPVIDTWYHIAVARSGNNTKLFLNGTQEGSTYTTNDNFDQSGQLNFGASSNATDFFNGWMDEFRLAIGTAAWTANFTVSTAAYPDGPSTIIGGYELLLNFEGTDGSTTFTDSGGNDHVFTSGNGAQIDTAQFKFGSSSLLLDGVNDYLQGDGSEDFAFGTGDFTIDLWIRLAQNTNQNVIYEGRGTGIDPFPAVLLYTESGGGALRVWVNGSLILSGSTGISTGTWHHIALTRAAGTSRLFLDGVLEASAADTTDYIAYSDRPLIGLNAVPFGDDPFNGWIDQLRIVKGSALFTAAFLPGSAPISALSPGRGFVIEDSKPIIFRLSPTSGTLLLQIGSGSEAAQMSVVYAGELLVMERGVKWDAQHRDLPHARRSTIVSGMSESGNFLGRVMLSEWREGKAEFAWFTPDWYRENFEPFVEAALTQPFFWAWNPDEYPEETAFAWLIEDIAPETDPATRRMAATLSMRAIA